MNEQAIAERLVEHGRTLFDAPMQTIQFTKVPEADALLNDLDSHPHAFEVLYERRTLEWRVYCRRRQECPLWQSTNGMQRNSSYRRLG